MSTDLFKKYQPDPMIKPKPNGFGPRLHNRAPATSMIDVEIEISLQSPVPLKSEEAYQEMASEAKNADSEPIIDLTSIATEFRKYGLDSVHPTRDVFPGNSVCEP